MESTVHMVDLYSNYAHNESGGPLLNVPYRKIHQTDLGAKIQIFSDFLLWNLKTHYLASRLVYLAQLSIVLLVQNRWN